MPAISVLTNMASCLESKRRGSRQKVANNIVQTASVCRLPANIMLHIFRYLDLKTLCASSNVCRQWYHLVSDRSLWKFVDLRPWPLSLRTLWKVVRNRLSDSVVELKIRGVLGNPKKNEYISPSVLEEIRTKCPSLETLGLSYCDFRSIAAHCLPRNLKSLLLDHSIIPLGWFEGLHQEIFFPKLVELNLTYCTRVSDHDLQSVVKLKTLEHLNLSYCYRVGDNGVQYIASNLNNLKELDLSNCPSITDLGLHHIGRRLTGLKTLNLWSIRLITDSGIASLVHSLTELEHLNISACKEVTSVGLGFIKDNCKKLKVLNITGCTGISNSDVDNTRTVLPLCEIHWP